MCGIAGIIGPLRSDLEQALMAMTQAQVHRGPDGGGQTVVDLEACRVGLGHRRLAIQDLSEAGRQPMAASDSGNLIVFNGEIYNAPILRGALEREGIVFRGHSDTEVLLYALHRWGSDCLPRLEGMYALAYLDRKARRLLLARDPLGIKPLYYAWSGKHFLFASEVRALLASGWVSSDLDRAGIATLLAYGAVQEPLTLYRAIRSFPAGGWQCIDLTDFIGQPHGEPVRFHWRFPAPDSSLSPADAVEVTRQRLDQAVRSHLLSDVPVGIFLSSGLDSTLVATLAARHSHRVQTFTVGFSDDIDHSEAKLAEGTARQLRVSHSTLWLTRQDALSEVEDWLRDLDQPAMDGLNTYVISRRVRAEGIIVALSGQGGDELFGGYPSFADVPRLMRLLHWGNAVPASVRAALARVLGLGRSRAFRDKLMDLSRIGSKLEALYLQRRRCLSDRQMAALGFSDARMEVGEHFLPAEALKGLPLDDSDPIHAVSLLESRCYLGNTLLHVGDTTGMAHGLEIRVPMLDRPLLDDVLAIPGSVKLLNGVANKHLLRHAFPELLRPELLAQSKRGFVLPVKRWMLGPLRDLCESTLASLRRSGAVNPRGVDQVWADFLREPESPIWSRAWVLVVLGHYLSQPQ